MKIWVFVVIAFLSWRINAQEVDPITGLYLDDPILAKIDSTLKHHMAELNAFTTDVEKLNVYNYEANEVPQFPDSVYRKRIQEMDLMTPFEFEFNEDVLKYIKLFAEHRRTFTAIVLGRSERYFPMYMEKLDKYDMPLELRFLSVIESALNPTIKSPAGAKGLWQFMLPTGKSYGLNVTSYTDDRCDPLKATEAACQYLKFLHKMYGNWSMALAAYNAGPGNVNRAIRRSGGEMTYWKIREYLPRETRGYIPTFIAVSYMMTYSAEHNIYPRKPDVRYYEIDTVHFNTAVSLDDVADALDIDYKYLKNINPIYKSDFVPASKELSAYLYLPKDKIGPFMLNLDTLSKWKRDSAKQESFIAYGKVVTHTVSSGESLGLIANKYNTTISELMTWNDLKSRIIHPGQHLNVHAPVRKTIEKSTAKETSSNPDTSIVSANGYHYYTIRSGDTLWDIANKKGVSIQQIKQLNRGLNERNLKVGQKIKISVKS